ncbi:murein hydrolase activator EnvC family protein [Bacillus suaedaesalsae]|uniref:Peptidoglycan DD-metalloendopeptidase family protein n=1 Tax=Bacillus suaedaesalsae TaxID=2810349 RepID=A0ABS2DE46_9BACI|nr:M23 family metallopeptidase [Bacillus suaedaesalsae]MBM6616305.1 peptidoglycan DD-metalloendopeptidase family protein [Bacillus suaedaesalsae]
MRRKLLTFVVAIVTVSTMSLASYSEVAASTKSDLNNQKKELEKKQSEVKSELNEKKGEFEQVEAQIDKLNQDIKQLDLAQAETGNNIRTQEAEIIKTEEGIVQTQEEIKVVEARIAERNELLKERVKTLQATGGMVQYLEVLLGSKSFSDFIDRATAVSTIYKADKDIIKQHEEDKALVEKKKNELEELLQSLETRLGELENLLVTQKAQAKQKQSLMGTLEAKQEEMQHEIHDIEDEAAIIAAEKAAIVKELARIKRAEEEAKKQKQAGQTVTNPSPSSTGFIRPAAGPVTSEFGPRWGRMHNGIDIGKRGGSVPIVAAAAGTVSTSKYSSSYGNVVYVVHSMNGKIYTTVYAHMESRSVSVGQAVGQGQTLGYMGNTGRSTGPHLHFEIHVGGWSKSNARNPRNYVNF